MNQTVHEFWRLLFRLAFSLVCLRLTNNAFSELLLCFEHFCGYSHEYFVSDLDQTFDEFPESNSSIFSGSAVIPTQLCWVPRSIWNTFFFTSKRSKGLCNNVASDYYIVCEMCQWWDTTNARRHFRCHYYQEVLLGCLEVFIEIKEPQGSVTSERDGEVCW